jgi:membrane protein DedA with SNARE-associated domain
MESLDAYVTEYGIWLVILNVFVVQIGIPVPAVPTLIVAGALSVRGELSAPAVFASAVLAALVADLIWYELGRWRGRPILAALCRMSLSPDGCIRQTDATFARFGLTATCAHVVSPRRASSATGWGGRPTTGISWSLP